MPRFASARPWKSAGRMLALLLFLSPPIWGADSPQVNSVFTTAPGEKKILPHEGREIAPSVPAIPVRAPMPTATQAQGRQIVNPDQIDPWRDDVSHPPKDTLFVNQPASLWEDHSDLIVGAIVIFLTQLLTISGLMINRRRKMAAEKSLLESETRFRGRLDLALEHKRQYEEGLELLLDLNQRASQMTERQICDLALDIAVRTTKSEIGYLHLFNDDQNTIFLTIWNAEALKQCASIHDNHVPLDGAGILADCIAARRPVIHNDYPNSPGKKALPEGHARLVRYMSAPIFDGDQIRMVIGVGNKASDYVEEDSQQLQMIATKVLEIVMRHRAENALHESEARFRFIADLSPGMAWVADTSRQLIWVNKTWLAFTGRSLEQELGSGWKDIIHPEDLETAWAISTSHFHARKPFVREMRIRRHDGQYRWMLDTSQPMFDEQGEFKGYVGSCLDITERKQAELEREMFQAMFTLSPDMMYSAGEDAYFKKVNPSFSKVLGYSEEELLARPMTDFILPEDRQATLEEMKKLAQGEMMLDFENRYRCKDGTIRLLSWHGLTDQNNRLIYGTARDITNQREAEEQLNKLWLAVEQTSHSIIITDLAGCIEYVNRAFSDISGFAAEEVLGQNPRMLRSGQTPASTYTQMWSTLGRGDIWQGEFINRRKNGEIYHESARVSPVRQPDGRITHYLAIKEDITEYKRTANAIGESKILLQRVIDSTPDWIHVKDREHRFMLVNQSFASAFNQTPERMIGRYDTDFLPADVCYGNPDKGIEGFHNDEVVFSGQSIHDPCDRIFFGNGEYRVFDTFKGPLRDSSQEIYGVLCYRRDITARFNTEQEQKALETQLKQAQKMELIGHLAGGIAHDFNNILTSMFGYAELIQMSADVKQNPQLSQYLQEILQAGIRAKELVAQLLTFSHKRGVATEAIDVAPIVKEVARLLRSTMPTSISIKTDIATVLPEVLISPVQLHQILMNLGVNSRDAMAGAGTIEIKAELTVVNVAKACDSCHQRFSGRYLMMSVRDTGSGILQEDLLKIFDPFFTTKEVGRGSGLGLSVLHGIVHSANGHIEVLTMPGAGTDFRIYLPAQSRKSARLAHDGKPAAENTVVCGHVMVVDDEASIVGFMTTLLENFGCRVTGLTSSTEALQLFQRDPYCVDMVITDQTMPELTGAELARTMLACRPDIPIVLSTGYSNVIDEESARQIGIRRFLVKPVPAKILANIVAEYLAVEPNK